MLDGQGCLLPVRHCNREDTSVIVPPWSGLCTSCRAEVSAETSPNPSPSPSLNAPPSTSPVACICTSSSEVDSERAYALDGHGELFNPSRSKSCNCLSASPVDAQAGDSHSELAGEESGMLCTSLEFDCSSTSPRRSAQASPLLLAQEMQAETAQIWRSYEDLEEVDENCRRTEPNRSSDAEVNFNKTGNEEEIFLESAGVGSSSVVDERIGLGRCEDGEGSSDRAVRSEDWWKQEDGEDLESQEDCMGAVENSGIPEDHSLKPEGKQPHMRLEYEERNSKSLEEGYGNSSSLEENPACEGSSSRSAAELNHRIVDECGKGCKRLRITNSDESCSGAFAESLDMFASGHAGKIACSSLNDDAQQDCYLPGLDNEAALRCLAFVPLSDLGRLGMVGRRYRDLVRSQEIFKLRRTHRTIEYLVFIYTSGTDFWTAYDARRNTWRTLPLAHVHQAFPLSDRESLSAGTHVLWLGKVVFEFVYYRYDLITNSWERGPSMVNSRCLFASASCGEYAFVAGGFGPANNNGALRLLNSAERYSSTTGTWEPLPPMLTARHKCSGFFMDEKFYVIGGRDAFHEPIMSGEEYNPSTGVWRIIPDMYFPPEVERRDMLEPSPPLVAVVNNQLYAVDNTTNVLKMYNKHNNTWSNLGPLPVGAHIRNGWGVAFKSLGDRLFVMGDADGIAAFIWLPGRNPFVPVWQRLCQRERGTSFLYNCAVMAS